jgi:anti-anti-sigma regulatory factor
MNSLQQFGVKDEIKNVVLDLENVKFMNMFSYKQIIHLNRILKERGGQVIMLDPEESIQLERRMIAELGKVRQEFSRDYT